jgi:hypothetical protein
MAVVPAGHISLFADCPCLNIAFSMDTPQIDSQEVPPHLEQNNLVGFLESLHRILKIGIYYPAGHKVLDQAAQQFQRNIDQVADTNRSVRIAVQRETLLVEGLEIARLTNALQEFKKLLLDLGIGEIEIDRTIPLAELLQFVRCLLLGRSQLQGIKEFTRAEIDNLPASVRVLHHEFLVDENSVLIDTNDDDAEHGLNTVFQILAEQGLERDKIEQCKKFLNALAERFSSHPLSIKGLPIVTWNEVRGLLVKVVTNAYQLSDRSTGVFVQNELNTLSSIFQGLEKEIEDRESQETISLLVSVFGGSTFGKDPVASESDASIRPADKSPVQSVAQLQAFVDNNFVPLSTLQKINRIDRREELTILLLLLQFRQEAVVEARIRQNMRDILTTPLNDREIEILIRGVVYLASGADSSRLYDTMQFLAILLRGAKSLTSPQFLVTICEQLTPAVQTQLWPILVNEILASGQTPDPNIFNEAVRIAAGLSGSEMKDRWQELELMDCFQEKRIAADIFDPTLKNSFPLYSFLLETSMKRQIGARILSSLMATPSDWLIEAVAPLLQLANPSHMKFLQIYLLVAREENFTVNLRVAAGNLVVHHLPETSEQQMAEPWVVKTIQATPEIQVGETRPLLERIVEEKRMLFVPKWPNPCRRAAAEALDKLKRRPR